MTDYKGIPEEFFPILESHRSNLRKTLNLVIGGISKPQDIEKLSKTLDYLRNNEDLRKSPRTGHFFSEFVFESLDSVYYRLSHPENYTSELRNLDGHELGRQIEDLNVAFEIPRQEGSLKDAQDYFAKPSEKLGDGKKDFGRFSPSEEWAHKSRHDQF